MNKKNKNNVKNNAGWSLSKMLLIFLVAFLLQSLFVPCLCAIGTAKMKFAIVIDVIILVRIIVAHARKEKDKGWIFYAALLLSSPIWIHILSWIINGH